MLQVKEEHEDVLHHQHRELSDLKGALKEEVETHDKYMAALKDEYEQELENLLRELEMAKEVTAKSHDRLIYGNVQNKINVCFYVVS